MSLVLKPLILKNTYIIKIEYEHGDADAYTNDEIELKDISVEQLKEYVKNFEILADEIDEIVRNYSYRQPLFDLKEFAYLHKLPLEHDITDRSFLKDYYAKMRIEEILYYDENGRCFKIDLTSLMKEVREKIVDSV